MKPRVSVAMAACNGEQYLSGQIDSILCQMDGQDELIISIDPCGDRTKQIAQAYAGADARIRVYDGPGRGVISNVENALAHAGGEYIFLSDQDDVWEKHKIKSCLAALQKQGAMAVVHDAFVADAQLNVIRGSFFEGSFHPGILCNIIRNRYVGCCMAFRSELLAYATPFPKRLPMHDQWLGIAAKRFGKVAFIARPLLYYRRHGNTLTGREKSGLLTKIVWRTHIILSFLTLGKRKRAACAALKR